MAPRIRGHVFAHPRTKYPWEQWTDCEQWKIVRGEDYSISTHNMQISLHCRARTQGLKVRTNSFKDRSPDARGYMQTKEGLKFQFEKVKK